MARAGVGLPPALGELGNLRGAVRLVRLAFLLRSTVLEGEFCCCRCRLWHRRLLVQHRGLCWARTQCCAVPGGRLAGCEPACCLFLAHVFACFVSAHFALLLLPSVFRVLALCCCASSCAAAGDDLLRSCHMCLQVHPSQCKQHTLAHTCDCAAHLKPSENRVLQFFSTQAESTCFKKASAVFSFVVQMACT